MSEAGAEFARLTVFRSHVGPVSPLSRGAGWFSPPKNLAEDLRAEGYTVAGGT